MDNPGRPSEPTSEEFNSWLDSLFSPVVLGKEAEDYGNAITAFENLTGYFVCRTFGAPKLITKALACVRIDYVGLVSMLKRFQRDAFGVSNFFQFAQTLVNDGQLNLRVQEEILERVKGLGVSVATPQPRKTRVAAAFSLWMSTFRPVNFDAEKLPEISPKHLELSCASLNFFLASSYLTKFGEISLGKTQTEAFIQLTRMKFDFTHRQLTIAGLENIYGAMFSLRSS